MSQTIALTGATGFIGGALAQRLAASGRSVHALVRPASVHKRPDELDIRWIEGDLADLESLRRLVRGADAVVHCAGTVRGATRNQFDRINVDGVKRVVQAVGEQQPAPRFLLLSSVAARQPHLSHYAASKRQGEIVLAEGAVNTAWTIFRPCAVYGPGERELLPLFRWMARGIAFLPGAGQARFSMLHVDDLTEAVMRWLESENTSGRAYELHDGHPDGYSQQDIADAVAKLRAAPVVCVKVPAIFLRVLAAFNLVFALAARYAPMLTPGKVRELSHVNWVCDNGPLNADTGWVPRISLAQGLEHTLWGKNAPDKAVHAAQEKRKKV
jgi:nucleoside-diphosphate-sugar epimerase